MFSQDDLETLKLIQKRAKRSGELDGNIADEAGTSDLEINGKHNYFPYKNFLNKSNNESKILSNFEKGNISPNQRFITLRNISLLNNDAKNSKNAHIKRRKVIINFKYPSVMNFNKFSDG